MNFAKLLMLKEQLGGVRLTDDPNTLIPLLSAIGVTDESVASSIFAAAQAASSDPDQTIKDFISDGGLARLLAGKQGDKNGEDESVLQCPHCQGMIVLS